MFEKMRGSKHSEANRGGTKRPKIHIGPRGGVRVDPAEFFAREDVQARLKRLREMEIEIPEDGLKLK